MGRNRRQSRQSHDGRSRRRKNKRKRKYREKKKKFRELTVEEEIEIARMMEEKEKEEKDLIEIRTVGEIVSRRFHKYLKVFEKKKSERMPTKKT